jgi:hypothetical protein
MLVWTAVCRSFSEVPMKKWWVAWLFCTVSCFQVLRAQSGAWAVDADGIWSFIGQLAGRRCGERPGATRVFHKHGHVAAHGRCGWPVSVEAFRFGSPVTTTGA